jgi:hypothetical protein
MEKQTRFRNTIKRRNYKLLNLEGKKATVTNITNEPLPLRPAHRVGNFSFLENFLPANHYNRERTVAMTRRNRGVVYPYADQNAEIVARIMEGVENAETETEAVQALNATYPNNLSPEEQLQYERMIHSISQSVNMELIWKLNTQFVQQQKPVPEGYYNKLLSSLTKKYLKIAIAEILAFHYPHDVKERFISQMRKRIILENLRKGWFTYQNNLL